MTGDMAEAIAVVLGGNPVRIMPGDRSWGVEWVRPDGKFLSIETGGVYLFASEPAYRAFHAGEDYEVSPVIDGADWAYWGHGDWPKFFASLIGGEAFNLPPNLPDSWHVGYVRPDGKYAIIGPESTSLFPSVAAFTACEDTDAIHYDF